MATTTKKTLAGRRARVLRLQPNPGVGYLSDPEFGDLAFDRTTCRGFGEHLKGADVTYDVEQTAVEGFRGFRNRAVNVRPAR